MTFSSVIATIAGAAFVIIYALWDFGAEHLVAAIGRFVLRVLTLGRLRISADHIDDTGAIVAGAVTVIFFFVVFVVAASIVN